MLPLLLIWAGFFVRRRHYVALGNDVHHDLYPQWDGETEGFDIRSVAGLEALSALKKLTLGRIPQDAEKYPAVRFERL